MPPPRRGSARAPPLTAEQIAADGLLLAVRVDLLHLLLLHLVLV
jgi:hypothetical protein